MSRTDEELDRDWKPSGRRPQSTMAQMFSQELMDIFRIDNSVADLDKQVDKRKQQINSQTSELEALEARIREMERRLKGDATADNPAAARSQAGPSQTQFNPPPAPPKDSADQARARGQQHKYGGSRPGTARQSQPAVPGALPPTPAGSEAGAYSLPLRRRPVPGGDSDSTKSLSSASFADYVLVHESDGDRERDV
ncbi:hypothetical protein N0V88_000668 [Collariella sp. IMI 366227]|nr:hypothetical protein N0V88_000668 [Collariella sp. IMI 366227]